MLSEVNVYTQPDHRRPTPHFSEVTRYALVTVQPPPLGSIGCMVHRHLRHLRIRFGSDAAKGEIAVERKARAGERGMLCCDTGGALECRCMITTASFLCIDKDMFRYCWRMHVDVRTYPEEGEAKGAGHSRPKGVRREFMLAHSFKWQSTHGTQSTRHPCIPAAQGAQGRLLLQLFLVLAPYLVVVVTLFLLLASLTL